MVRRAIPGQRIPARSAIVRWFSGDIGYSESPAASRA
jgi:hypothetical protein